MENIAYLQNNSLTFQRRSGNSYLTSKFASLGNPQQFIYRYSLGNGVKLILPIFSPLFIESLKKRLFTVDD